MVEELGVKAVGVSGKDGGLLQVEKKYSDGQDIGYVGEITGVNPDILFDMLEKDYLPIIAPIGLDKDYHTYNINADDAACAIAKAINAEKLAGQDLRIKKDASVPQILIYHTHSQEAFADSEEGNISDTIVGMGNYLTELLENKYGYNVIHNTSVFDMIDGVLDRNTAYNLAETEISSILAANPTVEVVIDLHRDGLDGEKLVTQIDGKQVAKIMFFNGLSRTARNGNVDYLPNPYIEENLAFSFQLQIKAQEYYPGFTRHIYLQSLRYNLHLKPRALLIEAGSQLNTVEEEKNAMEPLADILDRVLAGR